MRYAWRHNNRDYLGGRHYSHNIVWVRMRTCIACSTITIACNARSVVASVHASFMTEYFIACEDDDKFALHYGDVFSSAENYPALHIFNMNGFQILLLVLSTDLASEHPG